MKIFASREESDISSSSCQNAGACPFRRNLIVVGPRRLELDQERLFLTGFDRPTCPTGAPPGMKFRCPVFPCIFAPCRWFESGFSSSPGMGSCDAASRPPVLKKAELVLDCLTMLTKVRVVCCRPLAGVDIPPVRELQRKRKSRRLRRARRRGERDLRAAVDVAQDCEVHLPADLPAGGSIRS